MITTTYLGPPLHCYVGTAHHIPHEGTRTMRVVWRLHRSLAPVLFHAAKAVTG